MFSDFCVIKLNTRILYSAKTKPVCFPRGDAATWPAACWTLSPKKSPQGGGALYKTEYAPLQACHPGEDNMGLCTQEFVTFIHYYRYYSPQSFAI